MVCDLRHASLLVTLYTVPPASATRTSFMNDRNSSDNEPTVQLPKLPVESDEFDPDRTVAVEDWSQLAMPGEPVNRPR